MQGQQLQQGKNSAFDLHGEEACLEISCSFVWVFFSFAQSLISEAAVDAHIHTVGLHSNFCLDGDEDVMEGKVVTSQWIS